MSTPNKSNNVSTNKLIYVEPDKLEGKSVQIVPIKLKAKTTFNFDFAEFLKRKECEKNKEKKTG